jgi:hypothetical protein
MSLRGGTTKQTRRLLNEEIATLSLAMTNKI